MGRKPVTVDVSPRVMKWARESAGISAADAARRAKRSVDTVEKWESGDKAPTLQTLETLSAFYKRPLAAFFLPEPPAEPAAPRDFRVLPGPQGRALSSETLLAIREARRVQGLASELREGCGLEGISDLDQSSPSANPETLAARQRRELAVGIDEQFAWQTSGRALREWRAAVERLNVLVMQFRMPMEEARGFSLPGPVPLIVVNSRDAINGRIFTLFHEYAHLLIGSSAICLPHQAWNASGHIGAYERFCNAFAGSLLVPQRALVNDPDVASMASYPTVCDERLARIASRFKVSQAVILHRLRQLKIVARSACEAKLGELDSQQGQRKQRKPTGGRPQAERCLEQRGPGFVRLVLEAKARGEITFRDVADYLSMRLKHLDRLQSLVQEQR